ncbi:DUF1932 domain-containing protein [Bosea sp. BH3]|uniref:DUF1932 domain-containing protein n=1 Tax=Bosea sp. BH3 TaxID=2871701 RepID=UPI0021CB8804|nr:DUF1932 domain-containing protein [Bosea sp. BH3]MCU4181826.1 DUF1932 domain-containing protein [Bosea sp. BH3]
MTEPLASPRLAFVGFGEAAAAIATGLREQGLTRMAAVTRAGPGGPAGLLAERLAAAEVLHLEDPADLHQADVVFSLVRPSQALVAAKEYAHRLGQTALYVDMTSAGPTEKGEVADVITAQGIDFVDAAIVGAPAASRHQVSIVASGARAAELAERFVPYGMRIKPVGVRTGAASAIKIVRSVLAKGLEALYVEALLAGDKLGIADGVLSSFCDFLDERPAIDTAAMLVRSHVLHAERRADEMRMSAAVLSSAGVPPVMTQAMIDVMERTAGSGVAKQFAGKQPADLDAALAAIRASL